MNLHEFAVLIATEEGLKEQVNIAQIKEILKITLFYLKDMPYADVAKLLGKVKK
jgi:hypothetical protein